MNKYKVIFDTNVLVSASLFNNSTPRQALNKALDNDIILTSSAIFTEIKEVLFRKKFDRYITKVKRQEFINDLTRNSIIIEVDEIITECRDSKDNQYLELAVSGRADYLITSDQDLLILNPWRNLKIITAPEFLSLK